MISFEVSKFQNSKIPNKERIKMKKEKFLNNNQQHIELGEILNIKYKFCVNFTFSLFSCQCCWSIWYEACVYSCALLCASRPRQICLRSSTYRITLYGANDIVWVFFFWISCSMTYATKEKKAFDNFTFRIRCMQPKNAQQFQVFCWKLNQAEIIANGNPQANVSCSVIKWRRKKRLSRTHDKGPINLY